MKTSYLKNYIKAYENHFMNEERNDTTFENLQYAGWLLDKFCKELNLRSYYKGCYEDCKKLLNN